jgi:hypothetical protein
VVARAGNSALTSRVGWQANTAIYAKARIMVRANNAANAPFYDMVACPNGIVYVQYRDATGATAGAQTNTAFAVPVYLKVGRVGTTYTAYTSSDGVTWTAIAGSSRTMGNLSGTVQIGLAVDSYNAGVMSRAVFDETSMTPPSPLTPLATPTGIASYPISTAYNDASQPTSLTYSDNEVANYSYDSGSGWLSSLSTTPAGGSATTLVGSIAYSGAGGAAGHATSASVGGRTYPATTRRCTSPA